MDSYGKFFVDFLSPFFEGLVLIFKSIFSGIIQMLNILERLHSMHLVQVISMQQSHYQNH